MLNISTRSSLIGFHSETAQDERGAVWIFLAAIFLAILSITALVVDSTRQQLTARQLQDAADAAALAGTKMLDGSLEGWLNVKRASIGVFVDQSIVGVKPIPANLAYSKGEIDPWETDPSYRYNWAEAVDGSVKIHVERGAYWADERGANPSFRSLEVTGNQVETYNLRPHQIANAVRVTAELKGVPTFFAQSLGIPFTADVKRVAISILDRAIEECVAPIAIPACMLFIDKSGGATRYAPDNKYDAPFNCQREIVATQAVAEDGKLVDGRIRSSYYPRPIVVSGGGGTAMINRKGIPIDGVLGIPAKSDPTSAVLGGPSIDDFMDVLSQGCVPAKLGQAFRPIDVSPANGHFLNNFLVEQKLAAMINGTAPRGGPSKNFDQVFYRGTIPRANFPWLRSRRDQYIDKDMELKIRWPANNVDAESELLLVSPESPSDFTNPMCHSRFVQFPNDPARAKVREVTVMLVAPSSPERSASSPTQSAYKYCDFESMFSNAEQDAYPPASRTEPIVVGFKKAYFFDFNVRNLSREEQDCPLSNTTCTPACNNSSADPTLRCDVTFNHPENGKVISAKDPAQIRNVSALQSQRLNQYNRYISDLRAYGACLACVPCRNRGARELGCSPTCPPCTPPPPPMVPFFGGFNWNDWDECFTPGSPLGLDPREFCSPPLFDPTWNEDPPSMRCLAYVQDCPNGPTSRCTETEECATPDPAWVAEMDDYATRFAAATSAYGSSQYPLDQVASLQAEYQNLIGTPLTFAGTPSEYYARLCANGPTGPVTTTMGAVLAQMSAAAASNRSRGVSKPFRHCLPHKIDDCFNSATPGMCWENPRDRKPQYGCAGLRIRLSCDPDQVIASKNSIRQAKPQVVE